MAHHPVTLVNADTSTTQLLDPIGLDELECKQLVAGFGVPVPTGGRVRTAQDVRALVERLHPPLVVKILTKTPVHKSDIGGVRVGLSGVEEVLAAIAEMAASPRIPHETLTGYLVEEMAHGDHELIVGGRVDPSFGPVVMVGAGGVYVHVLDDIAVRVCPITTDDAVDMLDQLRIGTALFGTRGQAAVDVAAVVDALLRIGGENGVLLRHQQQISELDINPLLAGASGVRAVDARIVMTDVETA